MYKYFLLSLLFSHMVLLQADALISPIPLKVKVNEKKAALGKKLFFDTRLSLDNSISCATCHNLNDGGANNIRVSFGYHGLTGTRNAPTVYNAVFNFRQDWDGRAATLQDQATGPIENPVEMANSFKKLIPRLNKTAYKQQFDTIYTDGITKTNITNAIAEYEKTLITPNAPFDRYLRGDKKALSNTAKEGYSLFKTKGCILCHQGVNIGGNMYNKFGIYTDANSSDLGRYDVTHRERDKYFFKVPSLRNVARTAPYFHDGSQPSLRKAVLIMSEYQLGRKMTKEEVNKILAFLKSLNGELPNNIEP